MTERPTPEQLAVSRRLVAQWRERGTVTGIVQWPGVASSLLAEVDALTVEAADGAEADKAFDALGDHIAKTSGLDADLVNYTDMVDALARERAALRADLDRLAREAGVREGNLAKDRDAAIARAVAAEQRVGTVELALAELRRRAWLHLEYAGGYTDHVSRDGLRTALRDEPTDLAEALRRELLADGMDKAATELVEYYRVRAHRSGRVDEAQLFADLSDDITTTAADLRNGKPEAPR